MGKKRIKTVQLTAIFRDAKQVHEYFEHIKDLNIDRLVLYNTDFNRDDKEIDFWYGKPMNYIHKNWLSWPFGSRALPQLTKYWNQHEIDVQLDIWDTCYELCLKHGIGFMPIIQIPRLPISDPEILKKELPHLYEKDTGRFDIYGTQYLPILETTLDEIREKYPKLAGFEIWLAEGMGKTTLHHFSREDLERQKEWMPNYLSCFESYKKKHNIDITVFAHHALHTRRSRSLTYDIIKNYDLDLMEDLTWPEEYVALPFIGYLDNQKVKEINHYNPIDVNFLLDTEYIGQGRIPSVYPGWIYRGLKFAEAFELPIVNGRTQHWDNYATLQSWNRHNVDVFTSLANDMDQDPQKVLEASLARGFGEKISKPLAEILMESERLIVLINAVNGILVTYHSEFPKPEFLHRGYLKGLRKEKCINYLFEAPGTCLYEQDPELINADNEWRSQLRLRARSYSEYLSEKDEAIASLEKINAKIAELVKDVKPEDAEFISRSFGVWLYFARGMKHFVEAACFINQWINCGNGAEELQRIAGDLEKLAKDCEKEYGNNVLYDLPNDFRALADFIKNPKQPEYEA